MRSALALSALLCPILLSACAPPTPASRAEAATRAACRTRADQVFLRQNRDAIYREDTYNGGVRDSPYASTGLPGITTNGLGAAYGREQMESTCIRDQEQEPPGKPVPGTALTPPGNIDSVPGSQVP